MATIEVTDPAREVLNQAPRLQPIDLLESDLALRRRSSARAAAGAVDAVREAGARRGQRRGARARPPRRAQ